MGVRRNTTNRLTLIRECHVCGKSFLTTADSPFMRTLPNVDGKKQKICYFCSEACKQSTYKHLFDGKAQERKKAKEANRDRSAKWKRYYATHGEEVRARAKRNWYAMSLEERSEEGKFYRRKRKLLEAEHGNRRESAVTVGAEASA